AGAQLAVISGLQFIACGRAYAQMPGLALVDDIQLARVLALEKKPGEQVIGIKPAKPANLQVARVPDAVSARQDRGVAEGAQPMLMLHAAHHAGYPDARGPRRQRRGALAGDLVDDGDDGRPRAGEAQPGDPGTKSREGLVLRPVPGPAGQPGRLGAVPELK